MMDSVDTVEADEDQQIWRWSWRVSQNASLLFWVGSAAFLVFFVAPMLSGWLIGEAFAAFSTRATERLVWIAGAILVAEMARMWLIYHGVQIFIRSWKLMQTLLQANMLFGQMASGGPDAGRPVASVGEAISWFRDDPEDVADFIDAWLDSFGGVLIAITSVLVLGSLDWRATLIVAIPMIAVALLTKFVDDRIKRFRRADRLATAAFTGGLNDAVSASTSIGLNDARASVLEHLGALADRRRGTAVRDRVLEDGLIAFASGSSDLAFGLLLVTSATAIRTGDLSASELAVFVSYLVYLNFLPRMIGRLLARRKQAGVSYTNMSHLVGGTDGARLAVHRPLPTSDDRAIDDVWPGAAAAFRSSHAGESAPLESLVVENLAVSLSAGGGSSGVEANMVSVLRDVSFTLERGSFTVVTGPVGGGKSTLLRSILGLIWEGDNPDGRVTGSIEWNGAEIADRAAFFVPPRSAFLPQVPQLLSDSIADNVVLGGSTARSVTDDARMTAALSSAALDRDLAEMVDGVDTLIGPRGLRLSGGQRQRVATARALARDAELVVLDDVSSALDVETELALWRNLRTAGLTVLAVSHRPLAIELADQVLVVEGGVVTKATSGHPPTTERSV